MKVDPCCHAISWFQGAWFT